MNSDATVASTAGSGVLMPRDTQRRATPPTIDELRLLGKVARLYHEHGIRQPEIAAELSMSQARVSRLLKQAQELGIVRTVVTLPAGVHTDLEEALKSKFDLRDAVVVDTDGAGDDVLPALGGATATYLDVTLTSQHVLGVSSWSETLLSAVRRLPVKKGSSVSRVVQLVGGLGAPAVQVQATRLTSDLADRTGAEPIFSPCARDRRHGIGTPRHHEGPLGQRGRCGMGQPDRRARGDRDHRTVPVARAEWQRPACRRPGRAAPPGCRRRRLLPVLRRVTACP